MDTACECRTLSVCDFGGRIIHTKNGDGMSLAGPCVGERFTSRLDHSDPVTEESSLWVVPCPPSQPQPSTLHPPPPRGEMYREAGASVGGVEGERVRLRVQRPHQPCHHHIIINILFGSLTCKPCMVCTKPARQGRKLGGAGETCPAHSHVVIRVISDEPGFGFRVCG